SACPAPTSRSCSSRCRRRIGASAAATPPATSTWASRSGSEARSAGAKLRIWLAFLDAVQTERFDQVLALTPILSILRKRPDVGAAHSRRGAEDLSGSDNLVRAIDGERARVGERGVMNRELVLQLLEIAGLSIVQRPVGGRVVQMVVG